MTKRLPTEYQNFIGLSRYAKWIEEEGRRETWDETVERYLTFFKEKFQKQLTEDVLDELRQAILGLEVMPSMRCLMTAGKALERDNVAGFNCSYAAVDHPKVFDEILYILMCGTGVGFSVERQYVSKLPEIAEEFFETDTTISVADSKIGWAKSLRELISMLYVGQLPKWDLSKLRPAGAKLKTFGGRSSGPEPLNDLFKFTVELFKGAKGRKLSSIECHDLVCKIADIVVVGGVRRSALISLSNLSDDRMRGAKSGAWWDDNPQRRLANNSACYTEKPEFDVFLSEWLSLHASKSGERGIFSRVASQKQAARNGRRDWEWDFGTNPCSEIILRLCQFCNLSEIVARPEDTLETLIKKVRLATILGTLQSSLTDFRYLRKIWKDNTEEEALLGVSITGIMDNLMLSGRGERDAFYCHEFCGNEDITLAEVLEQLKQVAIDTNKEWAKKLGVNQSTAITCVKPSGTVSKLVDSASGIHARYAPYYISRVRGDVKDPLVKLMQAEGFPWEPDVMSPDSVVVFSFPQKSPEDSIFTKDINAIDQLKLWEIYQDHWCEHKPSVTISYTDNDFLEAGQWVYNKLDKISGISFLPYSGHTYRQAPYEEISEKEYYRLNSQMPVAANWDRLNEFEKEDETKGTQELACSAGSCELVDLT